MESLVDQVYKYVYARLRNTVFYTLDELNRAIFALMDEYNSRPMQVKGVSRDVLYFQEEYPVMHELPDNHIPSVTGRKSPLLRTIMSWSARNSTNTVLRISMSPSP